MSVLGLPCYRGFSLIGPSGVYSLVGVGYSLWCLLLLQSTDSRCAGFSSCDSQAPEHRPNNCGTWAYLLCGKWDLPESGIEPLSPSLAERFFTTEPPGKSQDIFFFSQETQRLRAIMDGTTVLDKINPEV